VNASRKCLFSLDPEGFTPVSPRASASRSETDIHVRMKIAFITAATQAGGAERVAITLANWWANAGHTARFITFEPPGMPPAFEIDERIVLDQLDLVADSTTYRQAIWSNFRRVRRVRRALQSYSPDVALAFVTDPNIIAVLAGLGALWPTVISERIHPAHHTVDRPWRILRPIVYPLAQAIVVQTADIARWFKHSLNLTTRVIPNPVDLQKFPTARFDRGKTGDRCKLIAVGRLEPQKGYDLLIQAFARITAGNPDWDLVIYGEGGQRVALQSLIDALGMSQRILLAGNATAVEQAYAGADLFVHAARYEGYPNAVQEALAAGKAVIATDCPGATRELLGGGRYGVLVASENVDALAQGLISLMLDDERRASLARSAREAVLPFEVSRIAQRWIELFDEVIERRG
jgi:GalNAc-alpha-(1->4)-GalNAc-alpha-(1->3)-diNAcBac-PP-undecaprenol alpha-1,4-N-acetyl-D-galactosaminyltransferase